MQTGQFRPLGLGDVLDGAFSLYRRHFASLFSTALLGFLPAVVWAILAVPIMVADPEQADPVMMAAFGGISLVLAPLMFVGMAVAWGALVRQVSQAYLGGEVSVADGLRAVRGRFLSLLGASLLWGMAVTVGFVMCIVPGILLSIMLFAFAPAVVLEEKGPVESLGRSRELAQGAWGTIFLTYVVLYVITQVPGTGLGVVFMGGVVFAAAVEMSEGALMGMTAAYYALTFVIAALTLPFMAGGITLMYYDRRIRTEALDLQMAADGLAPSA